MPRMVIPCVSADKDSVVISAILRAHLRGELGLWGVLVRAPLLLFGFFILWAVAMIFLTAAFPAWFSRNNHLIGLFNVSLLSAAVLWWSLGSLRTTNAMLSSSGFVLATSTFVITFVVSWIAGALVLTSWVDATQDAMKVSEERTALERDLAELRQRKPWSVIALPEIARISASGPIGYGSAERLKKALDTYPQLTLLELDSPGGFVSEEYKIASLVEEYGLDTLVLGKCASACTGVFLAGNRRFVGDDARLGFHQSGYKGRPRDTQWSDAEYLTFLAYNEKAIDAAFSMNALNTSYYSSWWPTPLEAKRAGFATNWWNGRGNLYR